MRLRLVYVFIFVVCIISESFSQCQDGNIDFTNYSGPVNNISIGSVTFFGSHFFQGGPGDIVNVQGTGIEGPSLDTLSMEFAGLIDFIHFGFAISSGDARMNAITAEFYDDNSNLIMTESADANNLGFGFIEGDVTGMSNMIKSVKIYINGLSFVEERYIIDNLEFTCNTQNIPTLNEWGFIILLLISLIFGALYLLHKKPRTYKAISDF